MTRGQRENFLMFFPLAVLALGTALLWLNERLGRERYDSRILGFGPAARRTLTIGMVLVALLGGFWSMLALLV